MAKKKIVLKKTAKKAVKSKPQAVSKRMTHEERAKKKLTAMEKIFVLEYIISKNPEKSATKAGYSKSVARSKAYQWVSDSKHKPNVYNEIQKRLNKKLGQLGITADRVLEELARIGFSNMGDYIGVTGNGEPYIDMSSMTREQASAIQEVTSEVYVDRVFDENGEEAFEKVKKTKFKLCDKKGSLKLLGDHLKLFNGDKEQKDVTIKIDLPKGFSSVDLEDV